MGNNPAPIWNAQAEIAKIVAVGVVAAVNPVAAIAVSSALQTKSLWLYTDVHKHEEKEYEEIQELIDDIEHKIAFLRKEEEEQLQSIGLHKAEQQLNYWKEQMEVIINNLDVKESNIEKLLLKTDQLSLLTLKADEYLINLESKLSAFVTLIHRDINYELSMESYFKHRKLEKFLPTLKHLRFNKLSELICKNEEEFNGKILSKLQEKHEIKPGTKRKLKKICLFPEQSWQTFQQQKKHLVLSSIIQMTPLLVTGFAFLADKITKIDKQTNKAKKMLQSIEKSETTEDDIRSVLKYECTLNIAHIKYDKQNANECKAITLLRTTSRCCSAIFEQDKQMKESVLISNSILYYRPSAASNDHAKELWDTINVNLDLIKCCYLNTMNISMDYFSFFSIFKKLFNKLLTSANASNRNNNAAITKSLQPIVNCADEFSDRKQLFAENIQKLDKLARDCIAVGIEKGFNRKQYQHIRENRDDKYQVYKETLRRYDICKKNFDDKYNSLLQESIRLKAQQATLNYTLSKHKLYSGNHTDRTNCPQKHGLLFFNTTNRHFGCDGCNQRMIAFSNMYGCRVCNYDLCGDCYEGNADVHNPRQCPGKHTLKYFHTYSDGFGCDLCHSRKAQRTVMYGCRVCNFDLCEECFHGNRNCPGLHGLTYFKTEDNQYYCDRCQSNIPLKSPLYGCRKCDYDLCEHCFDISRNDDNNYSNCPEKHGLRYFRTPTDRYSCDKCQCNQKLHTAMYGCRRCDFDLCLDCFVDDDEKKNETCPGRHGLNEFYTENMRFICDECHKTYTNSVMYGCRICDFDLCGMCYKERICDEKGNKVTTKVVYAIKSVSSGRYLDGRSVETNPLMTNRNPKDDKYLNWRLVKTNGGYYAIKSVSSGNYLDGRSVETNPLMTNRDPMNDRYLQWIFTKTNGARCNVALQSVSSRKYLDGRDSEQNPLMTQRNPIDDRYLQWILVPM